MTIQNTTLLGQIPLPRRAIFGFKLFRLILFLLAGFSIVSVSAQEHLKRRVIVITDMGNEPDDSQTLVRLLMYADKLDIEGIIASTGVWLKQDPEPELIHERVSAYGQVRKNLMKHSSNWPTESYLRSKIGVSPNGYGMRAVGDNVQSSGADLIIQAVEKDDPRPVHIAINCGAVTLAQAIWTYRKNHSEKEVEHFLSKIWVYDDAGQDDAGAWICNQYPDIKWFRSTYQVFGFMGQGRSFKGPQVCLPDQKTWLEENVRNNHGPLGALWPQRIMEGKQAAMEGGGTSTWIGLVNWGLYHPEKLHYGGWGGRFNTTERAKNPPSYNKNQVQPLELKWAPWAMYTEAADTWESPLSTYEDPEGGTLYANYLSAPIYRWRESHANELKARMDWCVKEYHEANHNPVAAVNGDRSDSIIYLRATPGEELTFDAMASSDPDNDSLLFRWFYYPEPGTYKGDIHLRDANSPQTKLRVPEDALGSEFHVILEVKDTNPIVPLFDFRRIVVRVVP